MKRVEFRLSMPSRGSWNGGWSGAGRNYVIVRSMPDAAAVSLLAGKPSATWYYIWNDGWTACITGRLMARGERTPKSDGFCGYDWMVRNIIDHGDTGERHEV